MSMMFPGSFGPSRFEQPYNASLQQKIAVGRQISDGQARQARQIGMDPTQLGRIQQNYLDLVQQDQADNGILDGSSMANRMLTSGEDALTAEVMAYSFQFDMQKDVQDDGQLNASQFGQSGRPVMDPLMQGLEMKADVARRTLNIAKGADRWLNKSPQEFQANKADYRNNIRMDALDDGHINGSPWVQKALGAGYSSDIAEGIGIGIGITIQDDLSDNGIIDGSFMDQAYLQANGFPPTGIPDQPMNSFGSSMDGLMSFGQPFGVSPGFSPFPSGGMFA